MRGGMSDTPRPQFLFYSDVIIPLLLFLLFMLEDKNIKRKYPIIIKCKQCHKNITCNNRRELFPKNKLRKFCNRSCAAKFNNQHRNVSLESNKKI